MTAWIISIFKQDIGIDKHIWGLGFAIQTLIYHMQSPQWAWQKSLFSFLVIGHSLRLATYIFVREYGKPEDPRYTTLLRDKFGVHTNWLSLLIIFLPQMITNFFLGLSFFTFIVNKEQIGNFTFLLGTLVMICGTFIESLADIQLYFFKKDPRNEGKILNRGMWKYSRHPNYFGECIFWWGVFLVNYSIGYRITILAPIIMHIATRFFSGVPFTEKYMEKEYGEKKMKDFQESTSPIIPGPKSETTATTKQRDTQPANKEFLQQGGQTARIR